MISSISRRQFVQFLGAGALIATANRLTPTWLVSQASAADRGALPSLLDFLPPENIPISRQDQLLLPEGFTYEVLLKQGDLLNDRGERYGDDNDYLAILPVSAEEGWLWCNHEDASPGLIAGQWDRFPSAERAQLILQNMGGSCVRIRRGGDGRWRPLVPDSRNFRINGWDTKIRLTGPAAGSSWVGGAKEVIGSVANCGGGISPWGTFFSAEENYKDFFGDAEMRDPPPPLSVFYQRSSHHYGYMVEIDPETREIFKHTALGRFAHENIAFTTTRDRRLAAYMGDDRAEQCLYKFVSRDRYDEKAGKKNRALLEHGTLHVADTEAGEWRPLDPEQQPALKGRKFDAARISVLTRTAASLVGGTPLARPEDVEVHATTGDVFVALTAWGGTPTAPPFGAIARLREQDGDAGSKRFAFGIFVPGGEKSGLAWPDNLTFTAGDHLIGATDYQADRDAEAHHLFGNNYLFSIPLAGDKRGTVHRFAAAPIDAEFCAPTLSPDRQELWVNVQHPGDNSRGPDALTSHWPDGGESTPRSALVAIRREKTPEEPPA